MGPTGAGGRWTSGRGGKIRIAALCGSVEVDNEMEKNRKSLPGVSNAPIGDAYISSLFVSLTEQTKRSRLVYSC